jgi:hypothetical protein
MTGRRTQEGCHAGNVTEAHHASQGNLAQIFVFRGIK